MGKKELIKPGLNIKIILPSHNNEDVSDIRGSIIYDVIDKEIIIAQTEPEITEDKLGEHIIVTFLVKEKTGKTRFRILAQIKEFIKTYKLTSQGKTHAIRLIKVTNPEIYNLRGFYRVELPHRTDIELYIFNNKVNLIDISLGGAKVSHNGDFDFKAGDIIKIILLIDKKPYELDAQVLRTWYPSDYRFHQALQYMALEFLGMTMKVQNIFSRKLIEIQRHMRYKELFNT
ncbi:MAG TPA: PilZ domain-containing protein [Syntrophorhabdaceae bacterium]|nr:PilZ domain-containing protein [Syntrophorhabdaceae bacterium]